MDALRSKFNYTYVIAKLSDILCNQMNIKRLLRLKTIVPNDLNRAQQSPCKLNNLLFVLSNSLVNLVLYDNFVVIIFSRIFLKSPQSGGPLCIFNPISSKILIDSSDLHETLVEGSTCSSFKVDPVLVAAFTQGVGATPSRGCLFSEISPEVN